ncbi:hypothetical protein FHN55_03590 [Streptomyces sp. NP160]|uniref:hypothetical protein n=1 Tax=Streptomyces sp. NP160 TaxID=2586637 RepID=UPI0011196A8F|nr:hypothetical protein [Streptomyces sp. NP160]TNM69406.1 hypothetical protein FHN55_03590 [Streptomyces sp. NP160]
MAPKQLLLEGPAIEPLLERVWAEHGADVKIVKAERVRVGGVAGFFAREQFEVTVEVPDPVPGSAGTASPPSAPTTTTSAARPAPAPRSPLASQPQRPARPAPQGQPAGGLEALLAAAEQGDAATRPAAAPAAAPRASRPAPAPAPAGPSAPALAGGSLDDFDAIFGAVTGGAPLSPAARAVAEAFAASSAQAPPAASPGGSAGGSPGGSDDDDPWVDGPPPGSTPRSRRPIVGRVAEPASARSAAQAPELEPLQPLEESAPDLFAPAAVLPETPVVEPWRAPWEAEAEAAAAARTAEAEEARAPEPAVDEDALLAPSRASAVLTAAPAAAPVAEQVALAAAPVPAPSAASVAPPLPPAAAPVPAPLPRRVGRSFAPLPAGPRSDGYALQRSAVLRLPETDPRLAPLAPLVEALVDDDDAAAWTPTLAAPPSLPRAPLTPQPLAPAPVPAQDPHDRRSADRLAQRLAALGVPVPWLWDLPPGRSAAMRELARRIGSAPVRSRTSPVAEPVVAVLADLEDALPVAQHLATGMGLGEEDVVVMGRRVRGVAPERCLPSRQELQEAAQDARADRRSLVVVLPAPIGAAPPVRAAVADTLEQLAPDEVWAVVDATRRLDDTAAWLTAVAGERGVDALALTNTEVTSAPAAALALPAPVVLVGDRPATPEAWVSMLAARLAAEELR